jgi:flagella basal body P-ring formation protein FlgA
MMWWLAIPLLLTLVDPARAETLVAVRTLRAETVLGPDDVALVAGSIPGTASNTAEVLGLETRVTIYQGRPIRTSDLGAPAIVDRNQAVVLKYSAGPLVITAEGRALGRGGAGDRVKVMNVASRTIVLGVVADDGSVRVASNP